MRAMQLTSLDGPAALKLADVAQPDNPEHLILEVKAAGVGFPDLLMTRGQYQFRPEPPFTPGVEAAGIVASAPADSRFRPGDRVAASLFGAWAERVRVAPHIAFPIPDGMSFAQATALVNYQTAYFGLVERGSARNGETLLVHGAAGGVGSAAVDVGSALGLRVIAVASGEEKLDAARSLGAEHCIDGSGDWLAEVKALTDDKGVDLVFDPVGGDDFLNSVRVIGCRWTAARRRFRCGLHSRGQGQSASLEEQRSRRCCLGRVRPPRTRDADPRFADSLAGLWDAGKIDPLVGAEFPLERAADALLEIEMRRAIGKIVLTVGD